MKKNHGCTLVNLRAGVSEDGEARGSLVGGWLQRVLSLHSQQSNTRVSSCFVGEQQELSKACFWHLGEMEEEETSANCRAPRHV